MCNWREERSMPVQGLQCWSGLKKNNLCICGDFVFCLWSLVFGILSLVFGVVWGLVFGVWLITSGIAEVVTRMS